MRASGGGGGSPARAGTANSSKQTGSGLSHAAHGVPKGGHSMLTWTFRDTADPLKQELNASPANLGPNGNTKPVVGRATLDVSLWDKLECTPYGRFDKMTASDTPLVGPNG